MAEGIKYRRVLGQGPHLNSRGCEAGICRDPSPQVNKIPVILV